MTVASDLKTALEAFTWVGITEPTFTLRQIKQTEQKEGYGWVDSGDEQTAQCTIEKTFCAERTTTFEIFIACKTEANYILYKTNVEAVISAKVVTNGIWTITGYPQETWSLNRYNFSLLGKQITWS